MENLLLENISTGQEASLLWAIGSGRFVQTIGLFLLGFLLSRKNLFVNSRENTKFWIKALIISSILFGLLYPLKVEWYDNVKNTMLKVVLVLLWICGKNWHLHLLYCPLL